MQTKELGNLFTTPPQSYWMASVDIPQYEQLAGNIGVDVDIDTGKKTITNYFSVSYADKGTHVVPRKRKKEESND